MKKPIRIDDEAKERILKRIADIAIKGNIDEDDDAFLRQSNIYQYELDELPGNEIVLTEELYVRLRGLAACSNFFEPYREEFGCYLFGKEVGKNRFLFHSIGKEQSKTASCEFNTTDAMATEIVKKIHDEYIDCVCHVHTHPNTFVNYSSTPSNYDLHLYAWFNEQFYQTNKKIYYCGALITPTEDTKDSFNDICFIFYDSNSKKFYKATNISYYCNGTKHKLERMLYNQKRNDIVESTENRVVLLKQYDV